MARIPDLTGAQWRKSSYSGDTGGQCVEMAALAGAQWRKSSYSSDTGGQCVEVAPLDGIVAVRDSKDPEGPALAFPAAAFTAFVAAAARGDFTM